MFAVIAVQLTIFYVPNLDFWHIVWHCTVTLRCCFVIDLCYWYDYYLIKYIVLSTSVFPLLFASLFGWILDLVNKIVISCHEFVVNFPWLLPIFTNPAINFELFPWICTDLINASSNRIIVLVSFSLLFFLGVVRLFAYTKMVLFPLHIFYEGLPVCLSRSLLSFTHSYIAFLYNLILFLILFSITVICSHTWNCQIHTICTLSAWTLYWFQLYLTVY